jgi:hypothetical protein
VVPSGRYAGRTLAEVADHNPEHVRQWAGSQAMPAAFREAAEIVAKGLSEKGTT